MNHTINMPLRVAVAGAKRRRRWQRFPPNNQRVVVTCFSSSSSASSSSTYRLTANKRTNLIFGANTDVGKTLVSAGLVRASLERASSDGGFVHYIKPLQCGGSDQNFVEKHVREAVAKRANDEKTTTFDKLKAQTLFRWETPTSPHAASILECKPCSDDQVLTSLRSVLSEISHSDAAAATTTYIETAGGVLSPSASSPKNNDPRHAQTAIAMEVEDDSSSQSKWGWITQGDLYQPLVGYAPVILVGDGRLGGISCTLSALESLLVRGYDVAALIMLEQPTQGGTSSYNNNMSALRDYVTSRTFRLRGGSGEELFSLPFQSMLSLPPIPVDPNEPLHDWYASSQVQGTFARLDSYLRNCWEGQISDLRSMLKDGEGSDNAVWWPMSSSSSSSEANSGDTNDAVALIDSASGDDFHIITASSDANFTSAKTSNATILKQQSTFDASASWYTQGVGHGESSMALAAAAAAGRYGHVSTPSAGVIHAPAVALAQTLIGQSGGWAERAFFTDDGGSSAVEVAIKMGIKTYQKRMKVSTEEAERIGWIVSGQEDCYHGDTLGALNAAEPYLVREHPWYQQKILCLATPTIGFRDGLLKITLPEGMQPSDDVSYTFDSIKQVVDIDARSLTKLLSLYKEMIEMQWLVHEHSTQLKIGSALMEPILQCTGGMKFIDPLWQRAMMEVAESRNIPVILDESTTGLYRLGVSSCCDILKRDPDIAIYSKLLTGGLLPLSTVLTSKEVFQACSNAKDGQSFLNGNSYVANPVGCVTALHALASYKAIFGQRSKTATGPTLSFDEEYSRSFSQLPMVEQSFTLGTVLAVTLHPETNDSTVPSSQSHTERIVKELKSQGIDAHSFVDVVYIMTSPLTGTEKCARLAEAFYNAVKKLSSQ